MNTGLPANSSAQMSWALDSRTLSVIAELQAGPEHLKAEFTGGRTDHFIPRWECFAILQHQVRVLLNRGLPSSIQTKAHYQVQDNTDDDDDSLMYINICVYLSQSVNVFFPLSVWSHRSEHRFRPCYRRCENGQHPFQYWIKKQHSFIGSVSMATDEGSPATRTYLFTGKICILYSTPMD